MLDMKWVIYIFSLYLLFLSAIPCLDAHEGEHHHHAEAQVCADMDAGHSEGCSPLCACACCGLIIEPTIRFAVTVAVPRYPSAKQIKFADYEDNLIPSFLVSIWHPPRLA